MTHRNPGTGETYEFVHEEPGLLRVRWALAPGGGVPDHVHPEQEERFAIDAGRVEFHVGGERREAGPGETVVVPPGTPHRFANRGGEPATAVVELRPALGMREFFETVAAVARERRTLRHGRPLNPLVQAALADRFAAEFRPTSPPPWLQRLVVPPGAALARRLGVSVSRSTARPS